MSVILILIYAMDAFIRFLETAVKSYIEKVKKYSVIFISDVMLLALTSSIYYVFHSFVVIFIIQYSVYVLKHYYRTYELNGIFVAKAILIAFSYATICMVAVIDGPMANVMNATLVAMKLVFGLLASTMLNFTL